MFRESALSREREDTERVPGSAVQPCEKVQVERAIESENERDEERWQLEVRVPKHICSFEEEREERK